MRQPCVWLASWALCVACYDSNAHGGDTGVRDTGVADAHRLDVRVAEASRPDAVSHDANHVDVTHADATRADGDVVACDPMNARRSACVRGSIGGAFFDGVRCVSHEGGCEGPDCFAFRSAADCEGATSRCPSRLCAATDGVWRPSSCGDYHCGAPPECNAVIPGCDCGAGRSFVAGVGCERDPSCTARELCAATDGRWIEPGTGECVESCVCGSCPGSCAQVFTAYCACGSIGFREFDTARGCVPRTTCGDEQRGALCTSTGGAWGPTCENTSCGRPSTADCTALACACPRGREYVEGVGCRVGDCVDPCFATCSAPNLCCVPGPGGPLVCVAPMCSAGGTPTCPPFA